MKNTPVTAHHQNNIFIVIPNNNYFLDLQLKHEEREKSHSQQCVMETKHSKLNLQKKKIQATVKRKKKLIDDHHHD